LDNSRWSFVLIRVTLVQLGHVRYAFGGHLGLLSLLLPEARLQNLLLNVPLLEGEVLVLAQHRVCFHLGSFLVQKRFNSGVLLVDSVSMGTLINSFLDFQLPVLPLNRRLCS